MKYVLGDNAVSYFVSYILDIPLIKNKTLQQLDMNSGPLHIPPGLLNLTNTIFENCSVLEYERFYNDRGNFTSKQPKNFHNVYSLYTRGKTSTEQSYLSQLNKYQEYVSIDNLSSEDSFKKLLDKIKETVNKTAIDKQLTGININQGLLFGAEVLPFERLISTINIEDLIKLDNTGKLRKSIIENYGLEGFNLPNNDKFIYLCELNSSEDKILSGLYTQILATGQTYYRKTYNNNKIIYECMRNIYTDTIENNKILDYVETTQISDNLDINKVMGIDLIGKFSQWKENTNLETIYNRCMDLKEFYTFDKNNHKKVL
tara:strand:- start:122 stop:1069 length:948 start_codon:yes stop_codon:yes gene_type:complete